MLPNSEPRMRFLRAKVTEQVELTRWIQRYYQFEQIPFEATRIAKSLAPLLKNDNYGVAYLAKFDEKTVGYFILTFGFDLEYGGLHATLTDLYFGEETRRTGIGSAAITFMEGVCKRQSVSTIFLQCEIDNTIAQSFYKKSGFVAHHRITMTKVISA